MDIETVEQICLALPNVQHEIKWKSDLVYMIARKMFCVIDLEALPISIAFKVPEDSFEEIASSPYFKPAPYFAQHHWVTLTDPSKISKVQLIDFIHISYQLVKSRLTKKALRSLDGNC